MIMTTILISVGLVYILWLLFIVVMALSHIWHDLPMTTRLLAVPAVLLAITLDVLLNLAATVFFLDLPKEETFSQRMSRYKREDGRRAGIARWVCSNLLDPFEIGGHCRD